MATVSSISSKKVTLVATESPVSKCRIMATLSSISSKRVSLERMASIFKQLIQMEEWYLQKSVRGNRILSTLRIFGESILK
jgi:hypothetical protein